MDYYAQQMRSDDMRLQAMRDEQLRKKEQGLPSFQELERTPLTNADEDKYMYEEQPLPQSRSNGGGLARDGSVLQGVGVGYGRRTAGAAAAGAAGGYAQGTFGNGYGGYETLQHPPSLARRVSDVSGVTAGNAGVGAGGQGVEAPEDPQQAQAQDYGGYYGNQNHNCQLNLAVSYCADVLQTTKATTTRTSNDRTNTPTADSLTTPTTRKTATIPTLNRTIGVDQPHQEVTTKVFPSLTHHHP